MRKLKVKIEYRSLLGDLMIRFIQEKQACGYRYEWEILALRQLDRLLCDIGLSSMELPKLAVDRWTAKRPNERPRTQQARISIVRRFGLYLRRQGLLAHLPDARVMPITRLDFTPYIFRRDEIKKIIAAADNLAPESHVPWRHLMMPEIFRLLAGCGMRVGEVLTLRVADVDLADGILSVRMGKFNKDRLVPLAPVMTARLRRYAAILGEREPAAVFFPAPDGGPHSRRTVYGIFRRLLRMCGIPHGGIGRGPRLHDLRHGFAVHRLESWYREGADLWAKLPLLATYLGHKSLVGTQRYLRLTPEIFPDISARLEEFIGHVIPRRVDE